jgi:hypothetical protein
VALKVTGLSVLNVRAIREVFPKAVEDGDIVLTATTATFTADDSARTVRSVIAQLPGRGHPRASLHAVARKLDKATPTD